MKYRLKRKFLNTSAFWSHVFDWGGGGERRVAFIVLGFTIYATLVWFIDWVTPVEIDLGISVAPYEFAGTILGALLVMRTNAGLDRWYEGRKLWGGIVNESRNLAVIVLANGPADPRWRREIIGWIAAFPHATRRSLRGQKNLDELEALLGFEATQQIAGAEHKPIAVALKISQLLRLARDRGELEPRAFLKAEDQRCMLIDHVGGCERILKTPLASSYVILIRRFLVFFLLTLPFALLRRVEWLTPVITCLIAYPILALDHIADDLQRPFSIRSINHLPLNDITTTIESNLLALIPETSPESP